jgi:UDP-4-amino-4-deoxy-L-arabinose-oxoglutarate aminotransferase
MSDLQAGLGFAQLERYADFLERRQELFTSYHQITCKLVTAIPNYIGMPLFLFRYTLLAQHGFKSAQAALLKHGVQARRGVDELLHRRIGLDDQNYPSATKLFDQVVSIPFYPSITKQEQEKVLRAVEEVFCDA